MENNKKRASKSSSSQKSIKQTKIEEEIIKEIPNTYIVKEGDTIEKIANEKGVYWKELYARNKFIIGNNPKELKPGMVLKIK